MFGKNPIRGLEPGDGSVLQVQEIFYTIQGEGPNAGTPAVFIRLGGCNLACEFCDTEFENFKPISIDEIIREIYSLHSKSCDEYMKIEAESPIFRHEVSEMNSWLANYSNDKGIEQKSNSAAKLVVITGGEPLRQNIAPLCQLLINLGFNVQIETNGTLFRPLPEPVQIVCSPKKLKFLRPDLLARLNALKFIISERVESYKNVPDLGQSEYNVPIYVQPMDEHDKEQNILNMKYAATLAKANGYRLSIQLHKIVGIP